MFTFPGLALQYAMNSATVFAGTFGLTSMMFGDRVMPATGAMSSTKLNVSFL